MAYEHLLNYHRRGDISALIEQAKVAVERFPNEYPLWELLGVAYRRHRNTEAAVAALEHALSIDHLQPTGHSNLGNALRDAGRHKEAAQAFRCALELKPEFAEAHNSLGVTLEALGAPQAALESYQRALEFEPNYVEALNNLASALRDAGRLDEALSALQHALRTQPKFAQSHNNLGLLLVAQNRVSEAISSYEQALLIAPDYAEAFNNLGMALAATGRLTEAITAFQRAISVKPNYAAAHYNLANNQSALGQTEGALAAYHEALRCDPGFAEAHYNLGNCLRNVGNTQQAVTPYQRAVALNPDFVTAWRTACTLADFPVDASIRDTLNQLWDRTDLTPGERSELGFALFEVCSRLDDLDAAFPYLHEANRLRKASLEYDISEDIALFSQLKETSRPWLSEASTTVDRSHDEPIFIVGMPRSGTTLIEQIISGHHNITGLGELPFIGEQARELLKKPFGDSTEAKDLRQTYYHRVAERLPNGGRFTDKMPHNFQWLPLLAARMREAKIVHVYRDPAATCWSHYSRYFPTEGLGYSYDLEDLVTYYGLYTSLMTHYAALLGNRIYHINYDALTANPEQEIRSLAHYLEIDVTPEMLTPHRNARVILTASSDQVREPLYAGSSESWKRFAPYLQGAFDALPRFSHNEGERY